MPASFLGRYRLFGMARPDTPSSGSLSLVVAGVYPSHGHEGAGSILLADTRLCYSLKSAPGLVCALIRVYKAPYTSLNLEGRSMDTHEAEKNTPKDAAELFFSNVFLLLS